MRFKSATCLEESLNMAVRARHVCKVKHLAEAFCRTFGIIYSNSLCITYPFPNQFWVRHICGKISRLRALALLTKFPWTFPSTDHSGRPVECLDSLSMR